MKTDDKLMQEYEYLWARTDPNWTLLKVPGRGERFCIFNKLGSVLIIENDEVARAVCNRMKDAGCEILDTLPQLGPAIPKPIK